MESGIGSVQRGVVMSRFYILCLAAFFLLAVACGDDDAVENGSAQNNEANNEANNEGNNEGNNEENNEENNGAECESDDDCFISESCEEGECVDPEENSCEFDGEDASNNVTCAGFGDTEQLETCLEGGILEVEVCDGACTCGFADPDDVDSFTCGCGCTEGAQVCSTLCGGEAGGQCILTCQDGDFVETEDCGELSCFSSGGSSTCE